MRLDLMSVEDRGPTPMRWWLSTCPVGKFKLCSRAQERKSLEPLSAPDVKRGSVR